VALEPMLDALKNTSGPSQVLVPALQALGKQLTTVQGAMMGLG